jgi:ERF superfamily protein
MNEITQEPRQDVAVATSFTSEHDFLARFSDPAMDADKARVMFDVYKDYLAEQRKLRDEADQLDYYRAKAAMQAKMPIVPRDKPNDVTRKNYSPLETIYRVCGPVWTEFGFSVAFEVTKEPNGDLLVSCIVTRGRYSETFHAPSAPPDVSGPRGNANKTQVQGNQSTVTYAKRGVLCNALGIVTADEDDDGNGPRRSNNRDEPPPPPPRKIKDIIADLIERFAAAPDRAAIEAIIAEHETQTALAKITKEPGRTALAECIANGRARFPVAKDAERPAFSAYVIDAFGEIVSEEIRDPIRFAHAVVDAWRNAPSPALANSVIEHNGESIEDARQYGPAALVLLDMKIAAEDQGAHDPRDEAPPYTPIVVEPPIERGKPFWPKWVQRFKAAIEDVPLPFDNLETWALAQRETIARAPMAQRLLAIRAIDTAFAPHDMPTWAADLVKADPLPGAGKEPDPSSAVQAKRVLSESGVSEDADQHWVEDRISDLVLLETRAAFNRIVDDPNVRNRMNRLRRERPALFEKADAAFGAAHRRLPPGDAQ